MTIGDIENEARLVLLDTYEDAYRFEPKEMFQALRDALTRTRSIRPESRYVNGLLVDLGYPEIPSSFTPTSLAGFRETEINMDEHWRESLGYYVIYRMYLKDDADTTNQALSQQYLNLYTSAVMS